MNFEEIRQKHNLSLILMHGSQVTGKTHSKSDFDIAVVRNNKEERLDLLELITDLETQFNGKVDISDLTFADPLFLFAVVKKCKLLSGNLNDFKSLERLSFFKYSDYAPYLKMESDFINERINNYAKN
ncbi:MAG: nucleotidyltransferase domain-containing protein [Patescibacteria group bacterium]